MQDSRKHFDTLLGSVPPSPVLPSSQLLLVTHLPAFLSYAGAQLGVYLGESASLGDIHLVSKSKLPPLVPFIKLPRFPAFIKFQYLCFPLAFLQLLAFILFQYLNFPPCPSTTSCIDLVSYVAPQWPPRNFLQASCFKIPKLSHTCASQQLPAFMRFQYLGFSPRLSATSCRVQYLCAHMV